jgi:hypothetical protein
MPPIRFLFRFLFRFLLLFLPSVSSPLAALYMAQAAG